jgi:uncharacterized protein YijF (DUF1287 family)
MSKYKAILEFDGGCAECPFHQNSKCKISGDIVSWRYTYNKRKKGVVITFNPHSDRLENCILKEEK